MLSEAIKAISELSKQANAVKQLTQTRIGDTIYLASDRGIETINMPVYALDTHHRLASFMDAASHEPIYHWPGCVLQLDQEDAQRRRVGRILRLRPTVVAQRIADQVESRKKMPQRQALEWLRDLGDNVPGTVLDAVAKVAATTLTKTESTIHPGRDRGLREFAADLAGADSIPDEFRFVFGVYAGFNYAGTLRIKLRYELHPEVAFLFAIDHDEFLAEVESAHDMLHQQIIAPRFSDKPEVDGVTVYRGVPADALLFDGHLVVDDPISCYLQHTRD